MPPEADLSPVQLAMVVQPSVTHARTVGTTGARFEHRATAKVPAQPEECECQAQSPLSILTRGPKQLSARDFGKVPEGSRDVVWV